jgi:hypothetical protein
MGVKPIKGEGNAELDQLSASDRVPLIRGELPHYRLDLTPMDTFTKKGALSFVRVFHHLDAPSLSCLVAEHCWDPVGLAILDYQRRFARLPRAVLGRR